jgi:hypothetical protein
MGSVSGTSFIGSVSFSQDKHSKIVSHGFRNNVPEQLDVITINAYPINQYVLLLNQGA